MWTKKTTMVVCLLVLVLGSCFAWPTGVVKENQEAVLVEVQVEKAEQNLDKNSLKQAEDLQNTVSKAREALSGKTLTKDEKAELEVALDNAEAGINAMTTAYKDLAGLHMGIIPTIGYTIGQPVANAFDIGVNLVANYKNWYATLGANKGVNVKDVKGSFTTVNGLHASIGFGFQLF